MWKSENPSWDGIGQSSENFFNYVKMTRAPTILR